MKYSAAQKKLMNDLYMDSVNHEPGDKGVAEAMVKSRYNNNNKKIIGNMKIMYDYECNDCGRVNAVIDELDVNYHMNFNLNKFIHNPHPHIVRAGGKAYITTPHTCKYCGSDNHNIFEQERS